MKVAIRYFSRGGHVKAMAEALSRGTGVEAISIDEPGAEITEHIDLLFIGGALYKFQLDNRFKEYLNNLPEGLIDEAICFGSSWLTRRPIFLIQDYLKKKGIAISKQAVYARNRPNDDLIEVIEYFAKNEMIRDRSMDGMAPYLIFKRSQEIKKAKEEAAAAGVEYVPDGEEEALLAKRAAEQAIAEAEAAEAAAREAEEAAQAAAQEAAEAAKRAAEKAKAAAEAAALLEAQDATAEEPEEDTSAGEETPEDEA